MRRALIVLGLLGCWMGYGNPAAAQEACVRAPNGAIVCGPIVSPRFDLSEPPRQGQPARPRYEQRPPNIRPPEEARPFDGRDDERDRRPVQQGRGDRRPGDYDREGRPGETGCPRNYILQNGECRPYVGR
jgi:hypothetical protein